MKQVLIAHQSTIPHYRVPFYAALERLRPSTWRFDVVLDSDPQRRSVFFADPLPDPLPFPTLPVRTHTVALRGKRISYQTFWRAAAGYDLVVVENAVNNLTYPLAQLHQLRGVKVAQWGHGRDLAKENRGRWWKRASEAAKLALVRRADGFFAYTDPVKAYVCASGLDPARVFVLNNTIDIEAQRAAFRAVRDQRARLRADLGVGDGCVLLFIGRMSARKRIDFLLDAFSRLTKLGPYHLLLVGPGGEPFTASLPTGVTLFGSITDLDRLAPLYAASDMFVHPGAVGLAPLQALCYDLPTITLERDDHGPEFAYLNFANALVLPGDTTPEQYANAINGLAVDSRALAALRFGCWPSIAHLTIDNMARRFADGVEQIMNAGVQD